ncbi:MULTISPECIES: three component ABC system middle component [Bacillus]|uniref:three component ABC system middle component n=1 Tax=Bacillus TaxID=1386 RepID=UPI000BF3AB0B|nr:MULTISPECIES: three component ABC system middle component [Bacillus]KAA1804767.1 hypothetical protein FXB61_004385 [Bacillus cereus]MCU5320193.1 DUF6521 family protein [Bacillus cereus]PFA44857.1 hypothetical protein CN381_13980 [Bacillus cereus]PKS13560.1 hypothetical protein CX118_28735 [Bacillus sp. BI3]HDR7805739.1 hypothetical protein [Bacillus cereus]
MSIKSIQVISLNPFFTSKIIQSFLTGYGKEKVDLSLLYLVLPFIMFKESRDVLSSANKKSSIYSLYYKNLNKRTALINFNRKYERMKGLTNESLIVASNEEAINLEEKITLLKELHYQSEKDKYIKKYYKAAYYLGVILSKVSYIEVYRKLGVVYI